MAQSHSRLRFNRRISAVRRGPRPRRSECLATEHGIAGAGGRRGQPCLGSHPGSDFSPCFQEELIWIAQPIPFTILAYRPTLVCLDACPLSFKPMKTAPLIMPFGITQIMPLAFSRDRQILNSLDYYG